MTRAKKRNLAPVASQGKEKRSKNTTAEGSSKDSQVPARPSPNLKEVRAVAREELSIHSTIDLPWEAFDKKYGGKGAKTWMGDLLGLPSVKKEITTRLGYIKWKITGTEKKGAGRKHDVTTPIGHAGRIEHLLRNKEYKAHEGGHVLSLQHFGAHQTELGNTEWNIVAQDTNQNHGMMTNMDRDINNTAEARGRRGEDTIVEHKLKWPPGYEVPLEPFLGRRGYNIPKDSYAAYKGKKEKINSVIPKVETTVNGTKVGEGEVPDFIKDLEVKDVLG